MMEEMAVQKESLLYEQVAGRIRHLIEKGVLRPGERVPSVRELSRQQNVSVSTAFQAYFLLEDRGFIEARPRSGFYVRAPLRGALPEPGRSRPSATATSVGISDLVADVMRAASMPDVLPLGAATPNAALLPTARLNRCLIKVIRQHGVESNAYDFPPGNPALRRQIARRSLAWGGSLSAEEIVITNGCMEALTLCLRVVARPGDTIAIESPTFYGHLQAIESLGLKALEIATDPRDGMSLDALELALSRQDVRACLVTNFNQPLGSLMPDENKQRLVKMLARHDIPLIEDDLYGELYFGSRRPVTAKSFDRKGLVLLCASFSKTLAPGYRVGWVAPGRFQEKVEQLKFMTSIGTAAPLQMAVAEFLQGGGYDRHLQEMRRACARQVDTMSGAIARYFPEGTKATRPAGGHVLWVELPKSVDSLELFRRALEQKIGLAPGPIFSAKGKYRNFIRLNCANPWSERIEKGLERLGELVAHGLHSSAGR